MRRFFVVVLPVLALVAGCARDQAVEVHGTVERDRLELIAESNERIVEIAVHEGDRVAAGAVLVRQGSCSTVRDGSPPELHRDASGCLTLTITFITLFGEDTSVTGTGSAGVETRILHADTTTMPLPGGRNLTLNATCRCGDGWARWINSSLKSSAASDNITAQNYSVARTSYGFRLDAVGVVALTVKLAVIEMKVSK